MALNPGELNLAKDTKEGSVSPRDREHLIGPVCPQGFRSHGQSPPDSDNVIGPCLPPPGRADIIGPSLPPGLVVNVQSDEDSPIGPALPPRSSHSASRERPEDESRKHPEVVPVLGPDCRKSGDDTESGSDSDTGFMGPALPPGFKLNPGLTAVKGPSLPQGKWDNIDDEDDYNTVGPLPAEMDHGGQSSVVEEFEKRATSMKEKLTKTVDAPLVRESWMTELPPEMGVNFGLSARKFRSKPTTVGEDRSCWTDTPADRARKLQEEASGKGRSPGGRTIQQNTRDVRIAEQVDNFNKNKRKDTLLEMHQSERKKKKAETAEVDGPRERRPFDRERDLQVNRFDDAMRKSVIKKSQQLNTRFSHGSNSQFL